MDTKTLQDINRQLSDIRMRLRNLEGLEKQNHEYIAAVDAITAPDATLGWVKIYVDTADGKLKSKFGDGEIQVLSHNVIDDLTDVTISSPVSGHILRHNGSVWVNVLGNLDALSDVAISAPATGQVVRYNGTSWVNAASVLDDHSDVTLSSPTTNHLLRHNGTNWVNTLGNLDVLSDVAITTPATGQALRYNGTTWVNAALSLDDLSDVAITSPAFDSFLRYNGSTWFDTLVNIADLNDVSTGGVAEGHSLRNIGGVWTNKEYPPWLVVNSTADTTFTTSATTISVSNVITDSDEVVYSLASGEVTLTQTGTYFIMYQVSIGHNSGSAVADGRCWMEKGGGELVHSRTYFHLPASTNGFMTCTAAVISPCTTSSTFRIRAIRENGSDTLRSIGTYTSMTIHQLTRDTS